MTLTEREATEAYEALASALRDSELEWILSQVEEQIALGKVGLKRVSVSERELFNSDEDLLLFEAPKRRKVPATFAVSHDYTAQERLAILVESTRIGVIETDQIADNIEEFAANDIGVPVVAFAPEGEVKPAFRLDPVERSDRRVNMRRLSGLLDELQAEVADAP